MFHRVPSSPRGPFWFCSWVEASVSLSALEVESLGDGDPVRNFGIQLIAGSERVFGNIKI